MPRTFSDAEQDSYVTQGLALGVLSYGVRWIPSDKLAFEFALSRAWRSFPSAALFPRVMSDRRADPYYLLRGSQRRRGPILAAWEELSRGWLPYVWNDGWAVDESGQMLSSWSETPWDHWRQLADLFLEYYRGRAMLDC